MKFLATLNIQYDAIKVSGKSAINLPSICEGPCWNCAEVLKPCWNKPALKKGEQSKGLIAFSLANGPENHFSQQGVMPDDKKAKFLRAERSKFVKGIDFDICSQSDVFVLFVARLFYGNVVRNRIASGRNQMTVLVQINISSASATNYISPYIPKKNHTFKKHPAASEAKYYAIKVPEEREDNLPIISGGPWKNNCEALKIARTSQHRIANTVVVAGYSVATLVLPDTRED